MILFKEHHLQREFLRLDPRLYKIIYTMEKVAKCIWGDGLLVTSIYRNDNSTHNCPPPYRFIDIAILEHGGIMGSETLRKAINILFPYGKEGYETIPVLRHGTAPHFHVQVRPK